MNQTHNAYSGPINRPPGPSFVPGAVPTYQQPPFSQPAFPPGPSSGPMQSSYLPPPDGAKGHFRPPMPSQQGPVVGGNRAGPMNSHPGMLANNFGAMSLQVLGPVCSLVLAALTSWNNYIQN